MALFTINWVKGQQFSNMIGYDKRIPVRLSENANRHFNLQENKTIQEKY